jgi:signal transduction histidine kinase
MVNRARRQESPEEQFVTNAAHELQSPLTAIVSAVEVLQAGAKDTPERDIFLDHIEQAAARLVRLTRSLLVLSRIQTRFEAPRTELVELEPLLSDVAARVRTQKGVDLVVSCPADAAVVTNRELVDHAVFNVLTNATNYTTNGRIELSARLNGGAAEICISDTGPGIPETEQARVFERFYRAEARTDHGSGLGLPIARAAIEAVGGVVELESEVGAGTTVRFRFPQGASLVAE